MQGQNDPTYEYIVKSVSSIIFLSTPHRGTNLAETLNRILQVSFVTNPMQFIAELAAGSQTLQKLNEQFRHVAPKLQIVSFYETRPTTMFKKAQIVGNIVRERDQEQSNRGLCRWFWRRTRPYWATLERYQSPLTQIIMEYANMKAPTILAISPSGTF
jgi:hypothetical protein